MTAAPLIECVSLGHGYRRGGETVKVLDQLDLAIEGGDFVAIMGPSGSGKSTLLNLMGGLDRPTAGTIRVQGVDLGALPAATLARWRARTVGFVFQFYNLLPVLSALGNVMLPLLLTDLGRRARRDNAVTALRLVGLEDRARHRPAELSGGQQQRVAIARAVVADPQLLICDEPTGDLDRQSADEVLALLATLNRELGKTVVMVTHDPRAAEHARRVLYMDKGALLERSA